MNNLTFFTIYTSTKVDASEHTLRQAGISTLIIRSKPGMSSQTRSVFTGNLHVINLHVIHE